MTRKPSRLLEFPIFSAGRPYESGPPISERVIFDDCGEFVAVLSHRMAHPNDPNGLVPCWIVNRDGVPMAAADNVPPMNQNPIQIENPLPAGQGVPLAWLGLRQGDGYPDPEVWK